MDFQAVERKWQARWAEQKAFEADAPHGGLGTGTKAKAGAKGPQVPRKCFGAIVYPYLNGPLHLGHAFTNLRTDAYVRFRQLCGERTLEAFGFHATGEPIVGMAKRVKARDPAQLAVLKDSGVPAKDIARFEDPAYIVRFYRELDQRVAQAFGFAVDWRRSFTTIEPAYQRFIEWQYLRLKEKGYVVQGTHPVIWCPACKSPTGDHDRLEGVGASPQELTLLKFKLGDAYIVAATLRPETVYGVTNLWLNPKSTLVKAEVDGERWLIAKEGVPKLAEQQKRVRVLEEVPAKQLLEKEAENAVTKQKVPVLAAAFVDPKHATGVVMSVPAHAPYDLVALRELKSAIKPIAVIGSGVPAAEVVDKHGIKSQGDPKLAHATKGLYKHEFAKGVLNEKCGPYKGLRVSEAKERLIADFKEQGLAATMWEPDEPVVCRSGDACIVKILENQWFLKYSDPEWKAAAKRVLAGVQLLPEDVRTAFERTIDWLQDKACARKSGLGTKLPWDKEWIVETLSDSTVYLTFYTIAHKLPPAEKLAPAVFDYVLTGKNKAAAERAVPEKQLEQLREEFLYWYPADFYNSADELVYNHLTFLLFHHAALFPEAQWPKRIAVNGMVSVEGEKMSKSKGNFITLHDAIRSWGADLSRLGLLTAAEGLAQPNWSEANVRALQGWLGALEEWAAIAPGAGSGLRHAGAPAKANPADAWLRSRLAKHVAAAADAYNQSKYRSALQACLFDLSNDVKWYLRRGPAGAALAEAVDAAICMLFPVTPHFSSELAEQRGIALRWPKPGKADPAAELAESEIMATAEDVRSVLKLVGAKPKRITLYAASAWKFSVYHEILAANRKGTKLQIGQLMQNPELRKQGAHAAKFIERLQKMALLGDALQPAEEFRALEAAVPFFAKEFGCRVEVVRAEDAKSEKALRAEPGKPGIEVA